MTVNHPLGSFENPIRCHGVQGERDYLARLCGPDGAPITHQRQGSVEGLGGHFYDCYAVHCPALPQPIYLYFDMYAKGPREKRPAFGLHWVTEFLKPKAWERLGYMNEVIKAKFKGTEPDLPQQYGYLYSKAGALLGRGPYVYAAMDYFQLPEPEWDLAGILACASQVVHDLKGINMDQPISAGSPELIVQFLATFHFECAFANLSPQKIRGAFAVDAYHRATGVTTRIFFCVTA